MMDYAVILPEVRECAKRVVALMARSCEGVKNENDIKANVSIVMGMLVAEIQRESEAIQCSDK